MYSKIGMHVAMKMVQSVFSMYIYDISMYIYDISMYIYDISMCMYDISMYIPTIILPKQ